jgi:hypothetical protein
MIAPLLRLIGLGLVALACQHSESEEEKTSSPHVDSASPVSPKAPVSKAPPLDLCDEVSKRVEAYQYNRFFFSSDHNALSWGIVQPYPRAGDVFYLGTPSCGPKGCEGYREGRARSWQKFVDVDRDDKVDLFYTNKTAVVMNERFRKKAGGLGGYLSYARAQPADHEESLFAQTSFDRFIGPANALLKGFLTALQANAMRVEYKYKPYPLFSYASGEGNKPAYFHLEDNSKADPPKSSHAILAASSFYDGQVKVVIPLNDPILKDFQGQWKALQEKWEFGREEASQPIYQETYDQFLSALSRGELCLENSSPPRLVFYVNDQAKEVWLAGDGERRLSSLEFDTIGTAYRFETVNLPPEIKLKLENIYQVAKKLRESLEEAHLGK